VAMDQQCGDPLVYVARTTSTANDLFYRFDALARFLDAQVRSARARNAQNYIEYQALGLAILRAMPAELSRGHLPRQYFGLEPTKSVVLIDEIDKAPRDFPNDILNEIEYRKFLVSETGKTFPDFAGLSDVDASEAKRIFNTNWPIIILTSNAEKKLPEAFLRRCVYYHIEFPNLLKEDERGAFAKIIAERLDDKELPDPKVLDKLLEFFGRVRLRAAEKPPATAEMISSIHMLAGAKLAGIENPDNDLKAHLMRTVPILAKTKADRNELIDLIKNPVKVA